MHALLLLSLLSQVTVAPAPLIKRAWNDGQRSHALYESTSFVAEPAPSDAMRAELLASDPTAALRVDRPTMRIWKVRDAAATRARHPTLRPVFHDLSSGAGRMRVPVGLVCDGVRSAAPWLEVLERSSAKCLPDFWYPPVLR